MDGLIRALAQSKSATVENVEARLRLEPRKEGDLKLVPGDRCQIDCPSLGSALEVHDGKVDPGLLSRILPKRQTDSTLGHGEPALGIISRVELGTVHIDMSNS